MLFQQHDGGFRQACWRVVKGDLPDAVRLRGFDAFGARTGCFKLFLRIILVYSPMNLGVSSYNKYSKQVDDFCLFNTPAEPNASQKMSDSNDSKTR